MTAHVETMAYRGATPWHGLGNTLTGNDINEWKQAAGLTWDAVMSPVHYQTASNLYQMADKAVIYRSDTEVPLGVVGSGYKPVQPGEVLEFFRDLTELGDFHMETAGVLFGGKKLWALARHDEEANLGKGDIVRPYLLLSTGLDGMTATTASFTTVRVVCHNTLQLALRSGEDKVRVTHRSTFNESEVKAQLGAIDSTFGEWIENAVRLTKIKMTPDDTRQMYGHIFSPKYKYDEMSPVEQTKVLDSTLVQMAMHSATYFPGQELLTAKGTAWGALNGITAFLDHHRPTRTADARLDSSWFGPGYGLKQRAMDYVNQL